MTTTIKRCPNCGEQDQLTRSADVRWSPKHESWVLADYMSPSGDCLACDWAGEMKHIETTLKRDPKS